MMDDKSETSESRLKSKLEFPLEIQYTLHFNAINLRSCFFHENQWGWFNLWAWWSHGLYEILICMLGRSPLTLIHWSNSKRISTIWSVCATAVHFKIVCWRVANNNGCYSLRAQPLLGGCSTTADVGRCWSATDVERLWPLFSASTSNTC